MHKYRFLIFSVILVVIATGYYICHVSELDIGVPSVVSSARLLLTSQLPTDETIQKADKHQTRLDCVKQECQAGRDIHYSEKPQLALDRFLVDDQRFVIFCYIPKNGCSFWKRVFSILNGTYKDKSVFKLSPNAIHFTGGFNMLSSENRSFPELYHILRSFTKVIFVRDPYERLFSGYIDKLFIPCGFKSIERTIRKHFRTQSDRNECPSGITFSEFLQYVTNNESVEVNVHFQRQYASCLPCHINYDFIGKMETFRQDVVLVLKQLFHLDPARVFGPEENFEESSDVNIMMDVVQRAWDRCERDKCVSPYRKMLRLWILLQVRGFLSLKHPLPVSIKTARKMTLPDFQTRVLAAYRKSGDRSSVRQQRHQALREAFRSVPLDLLVKVEHYVRDDCRLFDYNCSIIPRFHLDSPAPRPLFHMHEVLRAEGF